MDVPMLENVDAQTALVAVGVMVAVLAVLLRRRRREAAAAAADVELLGVTCAGRQDVCMALPLRGGQLPGGACGTPYLQAEDAVVARKAWNPFAGQGHSGKIKGVTPQANNGGDTSGRMKGRGGGGRQTGGQYRWMRNRPPLPLDSHVCSLDHMQQVAKTLLPTDLYQYVASGTDDEQTLDDNAAAFKRVWLRPRMLQGVSAPKMGTELLGHRVSLPVFVSPAGVHALMDPEGECATAKACAAEGIVCGYSQHSTRSIEDVAEAAPDAMRWFQMYILKDRSMNRDMIRRAERNGYTALIITVDSAVFGFREADWHNEFAGLPEGHRLVNYPEAAAADGWDAREEQSWDQNTEQMLDASATFADVAAVVQMTKLPVILKGIMTHEDATAAMDVGVDGLIVSTHGGRQLDGCTGALAALPEVVAAVKAHPSGRAVPVMIDSGVRRGTDVLKALALGASAVGVGKPVFFSLAVGGPDGVRHMVRLLRKELEAAMILCGVQDVNDLPPNLVRECLDQGWRYQRQPL